MTDTVTDFDSSTHPVNDEIKRTKFDYRRHKIIKSGGFVKPSVYHGL
ncbi:unnamed protein product, partial [Adineta steineri]